MIMAGQGTAAMELLEDAGQLDALMTPVGGGGLISGCSTIAKAMNPDIRVFGAEPEGANDTFLSLAAGERVTVAHPDTIADGLRSPRPGELTFPVVQRFVERIILVSDDEIRAAVKFLLLQLKILVEPSGAVAAAAVLFGKLPPEIQSDRRGAFGRQRGFRRAREVLEFAKWRDNCLLPRNAGRKSGGRPEGPPHRSQLYFPAPFIASTWRTPRSPGAARAL